MVAATLMPALAPAFSRPTFAQDTAPLLLVETQPSDGELWSGGPVAFVFDQTLDAAEIVVSPELDGATTVDGTIVTFTPAAAPAPGTLYRITVVSATATGGASLTGEVEISLRAAEALAVAATQPSDGAVDVDPTLPVAVVFNRPVVPLVGLEEQSALPAPLTFAPPVDGSGEWIGTSVYSFIPAQPLAAATEYEVTVAPLTAASGDQMLEPYIFRFTTAAPIVLGSSPFGILVDPATTVKVSFSQPMDRASTEAAFSLATDDETAVTGSFTWNITDTVVTFTPAAPLEFGVQYWIDVSKDALAAGQAGGLRDAYESSFTVVPLPAVQSTTILPAAEGVNPETELRVRFTAPVSDTQLLNSVTVAGILTTTQVISYTYSDIYELTGGNWESFQGTIPPGYSTHLMVNWYKEPNTTYTVTIGADVADPYGNTLGEPYVLHFTTGDYAPVVRIDLDRFTHYSAYTTTIVGVDYRNVDTVDARLYHLPLEGLFLLGGSQQWSVWDTYEVPDPDENLIWAKSFPATGDPNVINKLGIKLVDDEGTPLSPGTYLLEVLDPTVTPQDGRPPYQKAVLVLTNYNLTVKSSLDGDSVAWLTDLASGQPVAGPEVRFVREGVQEGAAAANADGIASAALRPVLDSYIPLFAVTGEPGDMDFSVVSSAWNAGISPWDFNLSSGGANSQALFYLYSDRPLYRPGQVVHWKGILRMLDDDQWQLPPAGQQVKITINDTFGNLLYSQLHSVDELGSVYGDFTLAPDVSGGYFTINGELPPPDPAQAAPYSTSYGFTVASYVKPEFEIAVTTNQPSYIQGEVITATVDASYYTGSPLVDAPVQWQIYGYGYTFNWQAPDGRTYSFAPFDPEDPDYNPYNYAYSGLIQEGQGTTDDEGKFVISLPADLQGSISSHEWSLDVNVTSPTGQVVYATTRFPVHRGQYYIGLSPNSYVAEQDQPADVAVITVTPEGKPYGGAKLESVVYEVVWNSVYEQAEDGNFYWKSTAERTPIFTDTVTTDDTGAALLTFTPPRGGEYQVTATGSDQLGNLIRSAVFVYASAAGDAYVPWPQENNDRIELVADKKLYAPGETAKILVPNPFQGTVEALVTVERSGVLESQVIEIAGSSETIEIPITGAYIPNVYVGVVLVKGVDETNPFPAARVGYVKLDVDVAEKELDVAIAPSAGVVRPGTTVTYTLTIRDHAGNPVPNAQTSVALVDKAVLALAAGFYTPQPMVDVFYYQRPLGVTTGVLLVINKDRVSQQLAEAGKGGGGGGGGGGPEVREDLADTAYWRADLLSDENGVIEFAVELPDNLTTWVLTAKSVTADTLVGEAVNEIVATKELQIRPVLPRFFTVGDRAEIGGVVLNASPEEMTDGEFQFTVSGAEATTADTSGAFTLAPNETARFTFPVLVADDATTVVVTMTAEAGEFSDGLRVEIPVVRYQTPEVVGASGVIDRTGGGMTEVIAVPPDATDDGELMVTLDPSLAYGLIDGLTYLQHYPYECNEQTVSRFLPNLFTMRALEELAIDDPFLAQQLSYQVGIAIQQLVGRQNGDGGWGYWSGQESQAFITSYVLWGLLNARELDYTVSESTIARAVAYLDGQFVAPDEVQSSSGLNQLAFMNYVLAFGGSGDAGRISTLYDVRERLNPYGQALLALAMHEMDPADPRIQTLLDNLVGAAVLSATGASWRSDPIDFPIMDSDQRATAMILYAFVTIRPEEPILPNVVRWLMSAREAGRWASTQDNAWAIIALTDWMTFTGELDADYTWQVILNDAELGSGRFDAENMSQVTLREAVADLLRDEANTLRIGRTDGPGVLYYTTHLQYYLDALAVPPVDRGIIVDRAFYQDGEPIATAQAGDIFSVTLTIAAPNDLYHVQVAAPIPAGTEAINPALVAVSPSTYVEPQLKPLDASAGGWYAWTPSSVDYRDDRVVVFATYLPAGTYEFTFQVRATIPGEYRVLPAQGELMYFPEVWGRSTGALFTVTE
jgi:hypothetical protein